MLFKLIVKLLERVELSPAELRNLQAALRMKKARDGIGFDYGWLDLEDFIDARLAQIGAEQ